MISLANWAVSLFHVYILIMPLFFVMIGSIFIKMNLESCVHINGT